jgi:hypothetical protein
MKTILLRKRIELIAFSLALMITTNSCFDKDIMNISGSMELNPSYSLPIGEINYNINHYFESLDSNLAAWPDTVAFNDKLFPNTSAEVTDITIVPYYFSQLTSHPERITGIQFALIMTNGYPTNAETQVYFLDESGTVKVDSVFRNGPVDLLPAELNAVGVVDKPYQILINTVMPESFLPNIPLISGIMVKSIIRTKRPDQSVTKFYTDYNISVHIGLRFSVLVDTGEL